MSSFLTASKVATAAFVRIGRLIPPTSSVLIFSIEEHIVQSPTKEAISPPSATRRLQENPPKLSPEFRRGRRRNWLPFSRQKRWQSSGYYRNMGRPTLCAGEAATEGPDLATRNPFLWRNFRFGATHRGVSMAAGSSAIQSA